MSGRSAAEAGVQVSVDGRPCAPHTLRPIGKPAAEAGSVPVVWVAAPPVTVAQPATGCNASVTFPATPQPNRNPRNPPRNDARNARCNRPPCNRLQRLMQRPATTQNAAKKPDMGDLRAVAGRAPSRAHAWGNWEICNDSAIIHGNIRASRLGYCA
jgi:hypothetical protein